MTEELKKRGLLHQLLRYLFFPNNGKPRTDLKVVQATDELGRAKVKQNQQNYLRVIRSKENEK